MAQSTKKYEIFEISKEEIDLKKVNQLEQEIKKNGYHSEPIEVWKNQNKSLTIIKGGNEYLACKNLGLEIKYVVKYTFLLGRRKKIKKNLINQSL